MHRGPYTPPQLLLEAAADNGDIAAATKQVELALFLQAKWLGE